MKKILVAYIPVIHEGYRGLIEKHADAERIYVFGDDVIVKHDYLAKEIRALAPEQIRQALQTLFSDRDVRVLDLNSIEELDADEIVMPDEDVTRSFAEEYLKNKNIIYDPVFLRWEKVHGVRHKHVGVERVITENEFMNEAFTASERSSDWWRKVGAVVVRDGDILLSRHNTHTPSPHQPYVDGDPRNVSHKGKDIEVSTAIHAEAGIIAEAARKGIPLDGCEMYVTDFPCPVCAKQIAEAGIKTVFFTRGYATVDGDRVLRSRGVELVEIKKA